MAGFAADDDPKEIVNRARAMIDSGQPEAALDLLRPLAEQYPNNTDILFFRGLAARMMALHSTEPPSDEARRALLDEAEESYRHILEKQPDLAGVRLELAHTLFARGMCKQPPTDLFVHLLGDDCDVAEHHFRRALAGKLPQEITRVVSFYLGLIQRRKRFTGQFSFALAPDTNVNNGTYTRTFSIQGLPFIHFEIPERQRETSGVGAIISAAGEYHHPLKFQPFARTATRLSLGSGLYRREHSGKDFDDMTLFAHAGPKLLFPRGQVGLTARAEQRWYGGQRTSRGFGFSLESNFQISNRIWLGGAVERITHHYRHNRDYDGPRVTADIDLAYAITPALVLGTRAGWGHVDTKERILESSEHEVGAFGVFDLPPLFGISGTRLRLSHDLLKISHERLVYPVFTQDSRFDRIKQSRITFSNDHLQLFGFVPAISLVHEQRKSNVSIFEYKRTRGEFFLRRLF